MPARKKRIDSEKLDEVLAEARHARALREESYRERALALFPHVCARCGREFSGKGLRELTVHHKDNDHMNNPPDGSNWELLCLYCHDNEHETPYQRGPSGGSGPDGRNEPALGFQPFEGIEGLLKPENGESKSEQ